MHDASFEVPEGSINGLIGPNGAGKTTIFNMIAGVFAPDCGEIVFESKRIDGLRPDQVCAAGIGRTFQIVKPFAGLSVLDNVIVGALQRSKERSPKRARSCHFHPGEARPRREARPARLLAHPARPQAPRSRARARHAAAPAAARRGDGRAAADRVRPDGRGVPRPQPQRGPDHPADRARDARGDGARASTSACCTTARSSRAARPSRWCATRRCSSATSARRPKV